MPTRLIFLLALAALACAAFGQQPIRWSTYQEGAYGKIKSAETRALMTEGDWQLYWRRLTGNASTTTPRGIDWNTEYLIAISLGERRTGGFQVYVETIERGRTGAPVVRYVELTPGPGEVVAQAITSPYVVVRVARSAGGSPVFSRRTMERRSRPPVNPGHPGYPGYWDPYYPPPQRDEYPKPIRYRLLDAGSRSGVLVASTRIMNTPEDLRQYWVAILGERAAANTPAPSIDWSSEYVAAIHLGSRVGSGHSVFIDSVQMLNANALVIRWSEIRPQIIGGGGMTTPYALVAIPRGTGSPTFVQGMSRTN